MAGLTVPDGAAVRGRNFLPLLQGRSVGWKNDFYAEYKQHHSATADQRMWRTPEWKLIVDFHNEGADELYHLAADPEENNNLIDAAFADAVRMKALLREKLAAQIREIGSAPASETARASSP